ncbi:MAG TPA: hypothetical protein PKE69_11720 [Pyrinomonadaceae bacterium]|nr:hypothetical protein [Pyrinomonadaceae bacterium]
MIELIGKLRKKEYAKSVYAFTSLYTFVITLQSEYNAPPKDSIWISFDRQTNEFSIGYGDIKAELGINYRCYEKQAESLIDAFILRLFLTENNEPIKYETEETPAFQIGQQVETILNDYSRKYHKGKIFEIVKHHKQNRFMYFIEENGKKLKKRYFKDNLKSV